MLNFYLSTDAANLVMQRAREGCSILVVGATSHAREGFLTALVLSLEGSRSVAGLTSAAGEHPCLVGSSRTLTLRVTANSIAQLAKRHTTHGELLNRQMIQAVLVTDPTAEMWPAVDEIAEWVPMWLGMDLPPRRPSAPVHSCLHGAQGEGFDVVVELSDPPRVSET